MELIVSQKYKLPFDLWECSGLATDSKEVLKQFKAIAFKDDKTKQLLYLRANALASMYEAYCKKWSERTELTL